MQYNAEVETFIRILRQPPLFAKIAAFIAVFGGGSYIALFLFLNTTLYTSGTLADIQITPPAEYLPISSSTPQKVLNRLNIADVIPQEGKFIAANLLTMELSLYQDGVTVATLPIQTKGKPGTPWETPSGMYGIQTKEKNHFSSIGKVYMPYSMQFYGNYFIHGWTYYPDGSRTAASFSGGCIKLETEDAERVFEFADVGTKVFVYDPPQKDPPPPLTLQLPPPSNIAALSYLVADLDTSDVYMEKDAGEVRPIASVTKLMTALVANEIISLDKKVTVEEGELFNPQREASTTPKTFLVNDLFYPLLMQSSNAIANSLAKYYGTKGFIRWMNTTALALGMNATTYADPSGISPENLSTPEDLFRLAVYLSNKKSFVLKVTHTQVKTITALDDTPYRITNVNAPATNDSFEGGKVGHTTAAKDTMLSVLTFDVDGQTRRVAVIVLGSDDQITDTKELAHWIVAAAIPSSTDAACVSCILPTYRKIAP